MTLDEAIEHAKEKAIILASGTSNNACALEHEQLAEWLEELKRLRDALENQKRIDAVLEEASAFHPYKVIGNAESYSPYNEGWTDAINFIESILEVEE